LAGRKDVAASIHRLSAATSLVTFRLEPRASVRDNAVQRYDPLSRDCGDAFGHVDEPL
jgi:hypothetical protein